LLLLQTFSPVRRKNVGLRRRKNSLMHKRRIPALWAAPILRNPRTLSFQIDSQMEASLLLQTEIE
jgi:hypothetical protein